MDTSSAKLYDRAPESVTFLQRKKIEHFTQIIRCLEQQKVTCQKLYSFPHKFLLPEGGKHCMPTNYSYPFPAFENPSLTAYIMK